MYNSNFYEKSKSLNDKNSLSFYRPFDTNSHSEIKHPCKNKATINPQTGKQIYNSLKLDIDRHYLILWR